MKGKNVPHPGIPESFKVLVKELQSLCLDVRVLDKNMEEIELTEDDDDDSFVKFAREDEDYVMDGDIEDAGYTVEDAEDDFGIDTDDLFGADDYEDEDPDLFADSDEF